MSFYGIHIPYWWQSNVPSAIDDMQFELKGTNESMELFTQRPRSFLFLPASLNRGCLFGIIRKK